MPTSPPDESHALAKGSASDYGVPSGEGGCVKEAERVWHDAYSKAHELTAYPESLEDFRKLFDRVELTPFCEGGWSWWADLRREALGSIGDVRGLRVLDYGCGFGRLGMYLSLCGASVSGFDLSGPAIETANQSARRYGLSARFEQMDAEELGYADGSFDLVVGFGVLHHVIKYQKAGAELFRILAPSGRGVFHETLWDNPFINFARRFTSVHEDAGDAHLTDQNIREFSRNFGEVRLEKRHLLYMSKRLAKLPYTDLGALVRPRPFWRLMKSLDRNILRFPPLRRYCGEVVIYVGKH